MDSTGDCSLPVTRTVSPASTAHATSKSSVRPTQWQIAPPRTHDDQLLAQHSATVSLAQHFRSGGSDCRQPERAVHRTGNLQLFGLRAYAIRGILAVAFELGELMFRARRPRPERRPVSVAVSTVTIIATADGLPTQVADELPQRSLGVSPGSVVLPNVSRKPKLLIIERQNIIRECQICVITTDNGH
jgi:hypothetical protein